MTNVEQQPKQNASGERRTVLSPDSGAVQKDAFVTVVFDSADEYTRFTEYVYDNYNGAGLGFTDVPIESSVRVTSELLEQTRNRFHMRPIEEADIARTSEALQGRVPFDPKNLDGFHVPGVTTDKDLT